MDVAWPLALYLGLKYLAYAMWCGLFTGFQPGAGWRGAWGLGLFRLLVGAAIGGSLTAELTRLEVTKITGAAAAAAKPDAKKADDKPAAEAKPAAKDPAAKDKE